MRKIFIILLASVMLMITSCSASVKVNHYAPSIFPIEYEASELPSYDEYSIDLTEEQMEICKDVYNQTCEKYAVTKEFPNVKALSKEWFNRTDSYQGTAFYVKELDCIYVPESFGKSDSSYFCHELFHYYSDNDTEGTLGLEYLATVEGKKQIFGIALNEGLANYFSTKVIKHSDEMCIYLFETNVAELLAVSFGEENLWNAFVSNDWRSLRDDFNSKLDGVYPNEGAFTPYEVMQMSLDSYWDMCKHESWYIQNNRIDQFVGFFYNFTSSVEETLYNYAVKSEKTEEATTVVKKLLANKHLDFRGGSAIKELVSKK